MRIRASDRPMTSWWGTSGTACPSVSTMGISMWLLVVACNSISGVDDLTVASVPFSDGPDGAALGDGGTSGADSDLPILPGPGAPCVIDGQTVPHGTSMTLYSARRNANCATVSQQRNCTDGVLDGSAAFRFAT